MGKAERMDKILHAPFTLKRQILKLIDGEIKAADDGGSARIILKSNELTEPKVIQSFYKASQAGVVIDLIIRGMYCIRPALKACQITFVYMPWSADSSNMLDAITLKTQPIKFTVRVQI